MGEGRVPKEFTRGLSFLFFVASKDIRGFGRVSAGIADRKEGYID
jgi:hypothetical protein